MSPLSIINIKNWPISYQLIGLNVAITAICITTLGIMGSREVTGSVKEIGGENLVGIMRERENQLTQKIDTIQKDLRFMASDRATVRSMIDFRAGFDSIVDDLTAQGVRDAQDTGAMDAYFNQVFGPRLAENGEADRGARAYTPADPNARAAQRLYIAKNSHPVGSKHELDRSGEVIRYNEVHGERHTHFRDFVGSFGLYDLFLIDPDGDIVYSVFKEADYATNIVSGPYASSGLSRVFSDAKKMRAGEVALVDFSSYEPSYGAPAWFCASPLFDGNELVGVLAYQIPTDYINEIIGKGFGETGQSIIVGDDRRLRSIAMNTPDLSVFDEALESEAVERGLGGNDAPVVCTDHRGERVLTLSQRIDFGPFAWYIIGTQDEHELLAPARAVMMSNIQNGAIVALLMLPLGFWFSRSLSRPIRQIVDVLHEMSKGNLTARIRLDRNDELGMLTGSVNSMGEELARVLGEVQMSSNEVASAATEIAASAEQLTSGMEAQRQQTAQVSAAIEEMSSSVTEVAQSSSEVAKNSEEAGNLARDGGAVVQETVHGMDAIREQVNQSVEAVGMLGELSEKIGAIVEVINDIADQTNLLALNAAIEAARAGEHGRGFAVVADEVRKLAERTMSATGEVSESVKAIQDGTRSAVDFMEAGKHKVDDGMGHAQRAGSALEEIVSSASAITPMIQTIAAAANQQAAAANEISQNIVRIDGVTNESADSVREVSKATSTLSEKSESLLQLVQRFQIS